MQKINKTFRAVHFDNWVNENKTNGKIPTWIATNAMKSQEIWAKLQKTGSYENLKRILVQSQGHICCYCGTPIQHNFTEIEHLKPQSIYRNLIFDYDTNLFASCMGGNGDIMHTVYEFEGKMETLSEIAKRFNVVESNIKRFIVHNQQLENIDLKKKPLKVGDKLYIFPKLVDGEAKHCNNQKGAKEICFDLNDNNLASYFEYKDDGLMSPKENIAVMTNGSINYDDAKRDIDETLNLNCNFLKNRREDLLKSISFNSDLPVDDLIFVLDEYEKQYTNPNDFGQLMAYSFVAIYKIKNLVKLDWFA